MVRTPSSKRPSSDPCSPASCCSISASMRKPGGVTSLPAFCSAALFHLATDLPAAVLARLLGIHIAVAVSWQRASAGDWAAYAADVSRRSASPGRTSLLNAPVEIADYDPRWPETSPNSATRSPANLARLPRR